METLYLVPLYYRRGGIYPTSCSLCPKILCKTIVNLFNVLPSNLILFYFIIKYSLTSKNVTTLYTKHLYTYLPTYLYVHYVIHTFVFLLSDNRVLVLI